MADEKKTYPSISRKNWFAIRKQFARTPSTQLGPSYVASVLDMTEESARANVVNGLKLAGLVDKDNKPTELAYRWRDDEQYAAVCEEIRQSVYPDELKAIAPDLTTPPERVERWFTNNLRIGENAAGKLASFYILLCEADLTKESGTGRTRATPSGERGARKPRQTSKRGDTSSPVVAEPLPSPAPVAGVVAEQSNGQKARPSLHIDIQIHISPEATADQIEHIFASMAKHLKDI